VDVERALITKIVRTQTMEHVVARGIEAHNFVGKPVADEPAPADVWAWMIEHLRHYRSVPSVDLFNRRWPAFKHVDSTDPLEVIIDEFVKTVKRRKLIEEIRHLSTIADDWALVGDAEVHMMEAARSLSRLVPTTAIKRFSDSLGRREDYLSRMNDPRSGPGVSFWAEDLDKLTFGIGPNEMAIIEGFLGRGKSSMAIGMAAKAYFDRDETPLFMSLEMDGDKLNNRWDAYAAGISYRALKRLELGEGDLEKWERIGEKASDSKLEKDILVIDDLYRPSVEKIYAEIERWRPQWTCIDTIDEVSAPSQFKSIYERQAYAARELKGVARVTRRPIVGIAQAGRDAEHEGATIGNIAGAIDIARKADLVIGVHASDEMLGMNKVELRALKVRDDEGTGRTFSYFWDRGPMVLRPWQPADAVPMKES
jgi:replicative DNA helicase